MSKTSEAAHGGPDAGGAVPHDFSTNGNACGPCPAAVVALQAADAARYPDSSFTALRERLAEHHGVAPERIAIAASASEFIGRMTAAFVQGGGRHVRLPQHGYGDYLRAARAWSLPVRHDPASGSGESELAWCCDPSSPLGQPEAGLSRRLQDAVAAMTVVLDLAYEPLRLEGRLAPHRIELDRAWQLWTPNKALGLTGVRAAYAIAPRDGDDLMDRLARLAPSWPAGAHGVALLEAWTTPAAQRWLAKSHETLDAWKADQRVLCESLGWSCEPSVANFFCARPDVPLSPSRVAALRQAGVKLRDTASFGLPGMVRLGVLPPASQAALRRAWTSARS